MKVDAQDISGAKFEISLSALPARVFQHEFDHLEVFFTSINVGPVFNCTFPKFTVVWSCQQLYFERSNKKNKNRT